MPGKQTTLFGLPPVESEVATPKKQSLKVLANDAAMFTPPPLTKKPAGSTKILRTNRRDAKAMKRLAMDEEAEVEADIEAEAKTNAAEEAKDGSMPSIEPAASDANGDAAGGMGSNDVAASSGGITATVADVMDALNEDDDTSSIMCIPASKAVSFPTLPQLSCYCALCKREVDPTARGVRLTKKCLSSSTLAASVIRSVVNCRRSSAVGR